MTVENERKKEYLRRYRKAEEELERLDVELRELRRITALKPMSYDGMPHGSGGAGDLSDFAVKADRLRKKIIKAGYQRIRVFKEIRDRIEALPDEKQKSVLIYRYIKGMGWEEIAVKMGYTYRNVTKIHGKALENLRINEKSS